MSVKGIESVNCRRQRVLLRVDYNVPVENGIIKDDIRIISTLKTLKYLLKEEAKIIILSHMGRPKKREEDLSLKIVRDYLAELLNMEVHFIEDVKAGDIKEKIDKLPYPSVVLFENLRFYPEEKNGDVNFAKMLSEYGDVYINDGFGVAHREEVSVFQLPQIMKNKAAGFLLADEVKNLTYLNSNPKHPYVFIIGGSKVSTKISIIDNIFNHASTVIIGGGLAFTFLKSQGYEVGKSLVEDDMIEECRRLFKLANEKNINILLPLDFVVAKDKSGKMKREVKRDSIEIDDIGFDIGELSCEIFKGAIASAKTVVWNGPMGLYENPLFAKGTYETAKCVADATSRGAFTVAGGGDSCAAIDATGLADGFSFISTGGGAMLEFLSGIELPGIKILSED